MKATNMKQQKPKTLSTTLLSPRADQSRASAVVSRTAVKKKRTVINDRYEMRIDSDRRALWERAKVLSGFGTLKDYLTHLADLDAEKVIEKHEKMTLTNDVFDMFIVACESASKPNDALLAASKITKEQGF